MTKLLGTLLMALALVGLARASASEPPTDEKLRQLVGQTIMIGFFGTKDVDPGFRQVMKSLEGGFVGGVLFLGRNIAGKADLEEMVRKLRECRCQTTPLIAIDEEGGAVERLGEKLSFRHTASAAEVGRTDAETARFEFGQLAQKLSEIGFNINLAPVVDLDRNPTNPIIGSLNRSFSGDPLAVSRYASIFIEEHHKQGIATALKHFPGHGSSSTDSHEAIANVEASWSSIELMPYQSLLDSKLVDAIMVGHLANGPQWGGVATQYGSHAIDQMLREQLKFDGVVLSDDLSMRAVRSNDEVFAQAITSAVRAGVDLVIVTRLRDDDETSDIGEYVNSAILAGLKSIELDERSVVESSERIRMLKKRIADHFQPLN
jgi:beta-N-acetylhexosaminidase